MTAWAVCIYCGYFSRYRMTPAICGDCVGTFGRPEPDERVERALAEIGRDEFERETGEVVS